MTKRATRRRVTKAARRGDLWARVETGFGGVEITAGEAGLRRLLLGAPAGDHEPAPQGAGEGAAARHLAAAVDAVRAYADGDLEALGSLSLDETAVSAFRVEVYRALRALPAGETTTYGDLATEAGYPGAARAVGRAMACNPWPLVVPCHRVLAAGGGLCGFGPGLALKQTLLEHEGAAPAAVPAR